MRCEGVWCEREPDLKQTRLVGKMRRTFTPLRRWLSTAKSPHAILGVAQGASAQDLKQAYRKKAMHLHPDRHDGDEAAFKELSQAYSSLASENVPLTSEEAQALFFQLFGADGDFGARRRRRRCGRVC